MSLLGSRLSRLLLVIASVFSLVGPATAQLTISPYRLILGPRDRAAEVQLLNLTDQEQTYRVEWQNMAMSADGQLTPITEPGPRDRFADRFIRVSPRQVTIPPRGTQVVRLAVRRPAGLEPGEYRSHLLFTALPSAVSESAQSTDGVAISIQPILAYSMPVIVRHGETNVTVAIESATGIRIAPDQVEVSATFNRSGNASALGNVRLLGPSGELLAEQRGISVYSQLDRRLYRHRFQALSGQVIPSGSLTIEYVQPEDQGGSSYAKADFVLN